MLPVRAAISSGQQLRRYARTETTPTIRAGTNIGNFTARWNVAGRKNPRVWGRRPGDGGEGRWAENFFKLCRG
jgi:hypothetical protein